MFLFFKSRGVCTSKLEGPEDWIFPWQVWGQLAIKQGWKGWSFSCPASFGKFKTLATLSVSVLYQLVLSLSISHLDRLLLYVTANCVTSFTHWHNTSAILTQSPAHFIFHVSPYFSLGLLKSKIQKLLYFSKSNSYQYLLTFCRLASFKKCRSSVMILVTRKEAKYKKLLLLQTSFFFIDHHHAFWRFLSLSCWSRWQGQKRAL